MPSFQKNLEVVRGRIAAAAERAGRSTSEIGLVAVSKTHSAEVIRQASEAGQMLFGENRVQEALGKIPLLPGKLRWHLIGHLQSNKVLQGAAPFRADPRGRFDRSGTRHRPDPPPRRGCFRILLEVNVSGEGSKHGFESPWCWNVI